MGTSQAERTVEYAGAWADNGGGGQRGVAAVVALGPGRAGRGDRQPHEHVAPNGEAPHRRLGAEGALEDALAGHHGPAARKGPEPPTSLPKFRLRPNLELRGGNCPV